MPDHLFNSEPHMPPAKLAEVTGLSADMQRDWRRRGYIENLGTQGSNGRWEYDWADALYVYLMRQMYDGGCELSRALMFAVTLSPDVLLHAVKARYPGKVSPRFRYYRFQIDERGRLEDGKWFAVRFNDLNALETRAVGLIVDCVALANDLPAAFGKPISDMDEAIERDLGGSR